MTSFPLISTSSHSSPSTRTMKIPLIASVDGLTVIIPSLKLLMLMIRELVALLNIALDTEPPVTLKGTHCPLATISFGPHSTPVDGVIVAPPVS